MERLDRGGGGFCVKLVLSGWDSGWVTLGELETSWVGAGESGAKQCRETKVVCHGHISKCANCALASA